MYTPTNGDLNNIDKYDNIRRLEVRGFKAGSTI